MESLDGLSSGWRVTLSELYERLCKVQKVQVTKSGSKITIASGVYVENVCIRTKNSFEPNTSITGNDEDSSLKTIEQLGPENKAILYIKT
jgi:hypothetical protein